MQEKENTRFEPAPIPDGDEARVAALHRLGVLDTPPDPRFDRFAEMLQALFNVPMALVSLVDGDRQWFKARVGLDVCETDRDVSFCGHAVAGDANLVVMDTHLDARFAENPLVLGPPHIRFYAGAILRAPCGAPVGTACILDTAPRAFTSSDLATLVEAARFAEDELGRPPATKAA